MMPKQPLGAGLAAAIGKDKSQQRTNIKQKGRMINVASCTPPLMYVKGVILGRVQPQPKPPGFPLSFVISTLALKLDVAYEAYASWRVAKERQAGAAAFQAAVRYASGTVLIVKEAERSAMHE